jgi:hypothetical protein
VPGGGDSARKVRIPALACYWLKVDAESDGEEGVLCQGPEDLTS